MANGRAIKLLINKTTCYNSNNLKFKMMEML